MAIVSVVLLAVFSTICVINYQQAESSVYEALSAAIDHDAMAREPFSAGIPPNGTPQGDEPGAGTSGGAFGQGESGAEAEDPYAQGEADAATGSVPEQGGKPFEIGGKERGRQFIPVAVYRINDDGSLSAVSDTATAAITDDVLEQATNQATRLADGSGLIDSLGLYYAKRATENGSFIAFADQASAGGWQSLALTLAAVGAGALVVFFAISLLFSKWALKPVEESWRAQQQFVADASHELKTPLTVMLANTSILLKHPEKTIASQSQWVESIETEAESMQRLVGDMLVLATPEQGPQTGEFTPVDISDIVERNLLQFESLAFEQDIEVASSIEEGLLLPGNAQRLERLVSTLLDNAYKYAGEHGFVRVNLSLTEKALVLSVANSGEVIPADDLPHIFDRFYRADKARVRGVGGYGLGLAIAREVAEEHGGTIRAQSSEQTGTVFTVKWDAKTTTRSDRFAKAVEDTSPV